MEYKQEIIDKFCENTFLEKLCTVLQIFLEIRDSCVVRAEREPFISKIKQQIIMLVYKKHPANKQHRCCFW